MTAWYHRDLTQGMDGVDIRALQLLLKVQVTGVYDDATERKVRGLRRLWDLPGHGVDEAFARRLGDLR